MILHTLIVFSVFLIQKCELYTFEDYRSAHLKVNDECSEAFLSVDEVTQLKFFDASVKLPTGIIQGHLNNLGAYDECLAIDVPEKNVLGKYCSASIRSYSSLTHPPEIENFLNENITKNLHITHNITKHLQRIFSGRKLKGSSAIIPLTLGICIPHDCQSDALFLKLLSLQIDDNLCITKRTYSEMTTRATIAWFVLLGFLMVAVVSTIYDVIITYGEREPLHEGLIAFSLYTNGKKLCKNSRNPSQLLCLNGLKTLNMIWVIAGHTVASLFQGPIDNYFDIFTWVQNYSTMLLAGATVSVDSFFTMGGILAVYTLLRSQDPGLKSNIRNIPMLYIHRYIRLTPALAIIVYVTWSRLPSYMADGPMWSMMETNSATCDDNWWAALLYIQNYRSQACLGQSWYLSVDMQLFILSPLIWIPLRKWPKQTVNAMFGLVLLGIAIPFGIGFYYKLPATVIGYPNNNFMDVYYVKTHARFATYIIGMIAGYYIYHAKQKKRIIINPVALFWIWTLVLIVLYGCIYIGYPLVTKEAPTLSGFPTEVDESTRWWNSIYLALLRPAWSTALAVLIYLCVIGYGGPIDWFLSAGPMQFLAKLSYSMYLNHILIILLRIGQTRDTLHFGNWEMINILISIVIVTIPVSILQTLLFESPTICLEKIIFGKSKPKQKDLNTSKNVV